MITINSWEELLHAGEKCILNDLDPNQIKISDNLVFTVRVCGRSWDGYIDYRGAQYITELQKSANKLYRELSHHDIPLRDLSKNITVKVRVVEGSSLFEIQASEVLASMFSALTGGQITLIAIVGILCFAGYKTAKLVKDYKRELAINEQQGELPIKVLQEVMPAIDKALDIVERKDLEKPNRSLINKLEPDDTISFGDLEPVTAKQARKLYPRKPRSTVQSGYFDDEYRILNINFEQTPVVFQLSKYGLKFSAKAELANEDIEPLNKGLNKAMQQGEDFNVSLQVFITVELQ